MWQIKFPYYYLMQHKLVENFEYEKLYKTTLGILNAGLVKWINGCQVQVDISFRKTWLNDNSPTSDW